MHIKKSSGALGAEITRFDTRDVNQKAAQQIYEAFLENLILVFSNQDLTPDQQIKFNEYFGESKSSQDHLFMTLNSAICLATVRADKVCQMMVQPILGLFSRHSMKN